MDPIQSVTNWPRLLKSCVVSLRNDLYAAIVSSSLVERVDPLDERHAKCLERMKRHLGRISDTTDRMNMLVRFTSNAYDLVIDGESDRQRLKPILKAAAR